MNEEAVLDPLERVARWIQSAASGRPYNFSWFREDGPAALAASGLPATQRSVDWLLGRGVKAVLSLTEWIPGPLVDRGLSLMHLPLRNGMPAPAAKLAEAVSFLAEQRSSGAPSLVHCLSGRGRTGMVLAAYLVALEGYSAGDAVEEVIRLRPGSLRNRLQVASVFEFERSLRSNSIGLR